ncbi:MAG: Gfo/Idh/MocA family oxidoreductase [Brachybacterium sp.]|nr:Gfo/Idh/MocA family oxidoreductase [Brachybacterium sp.]
MRIGLIGTENSHITHFTRFLNVEERYPGARATALVGGRSPRNQELAELGGIDLVVETPEDLGEQVDAGIVSTRDGAKHLAHARPLLESGKPVLVDKPLATSVEDAQELLAIAQRTGAVLVSCSALRFVPEIAHFSPTAETGALRHLHVVGAADPDSEYSGLFFYGIHHVEAALEILGNPVVEPGSLEVDVSRTGDTVVAHLALQGVPVTLTFVTPGEGTKVPFHATAVMENAVISHELTLSKDYNAPALAEFLSAAERGTSSRTPADLLSPVVVLSSIAAALERTSR